MSFLFGGDSPPTPPPVPPPVQPPSPPPIEELEEEEEAQARRGRERRSTILTGPRGILTRPPTRIKTLLGE